MQFSDISMVCEERLKECNDDDWCRMKDHQCRRVVNQP